MTIRHLKIFIEVAETGKMSAAADRCFISQPSVSQAVKELEEHYKVPLFERLSKKLYITEDGKKLLAYAKQLIQLYDSLEETMQETSLSHKIRIGSTITVGSCLLPNLINDMKCLKPELKIYSYIANTSIIEEKLLKSELDIGLVEGTVKHPDLIALPAINDFLVLVCSNSHPFAKKDIIHIKELKNLPFIMREQGSGTRKLFEEYMKSQNVPLQIEAESHSTEAIKNAVIENQYLAVVSVRLLENEIKNGQIHVIRSLETDWDRSFYLVYHKNKFMTKAMDLFKELSYRYKYPDILTHVKTGFLTKE